MSGAASISHINRLLRGIAIVVAAPLIGATQPREGPIAPTTGGMNHPARRDYPPIPSLRIPTDLLPCRLGYFSIRRPRRAWNRYRFANWPAPIIPLDAKGRKKFPKVNPTLAQILYSCGSFRHPVVISDRNGFSPHHKIRLVPRIPVANRGEQDCQKRRYAPVQPSIHR